MHDPGLWGHHAEVAERLLAPSEERVSFAVTLVLEVGVLLEGVGSAEEVDLHRVIDDQLDRLQRVDPDRVTAEADDRVAHRGEVHDARHAREVLEQDARRREGDLLVGACLAAAPRREGADVVGLHEGAVLVTKQVLEQDAQRERQTRDAGKSRPGQGRKAEDLEWFSGQRCGGARTEGVNRTASSDAPQWAGVQDQV